MRSTAILAIGSLGASALRIRDIDQVKANLIAGAKAFGAATDAMAGSSQAEVSAALQSASPSTGAGTSTGASFVQTQTPSKISLDKLNSIAAAVESSAAKHVSAGRAAASCGTCTPSFTACPSGFALSSGICVPTASYAGYCNKPFSLGDFSAVELEEFEVFCDACFPCAQTSFLQGDRSNLVKDGLFITQPLRADSQLRLNVIERASHTAGSAAATNGAYLRAKFDADLAKLKSSFLRFNDITRAGSPSEVITFAIESLPAAAKTSFVANKAMATMLEAENRIADLLK